jgi:hypothetical protein
MPGKITLERKPESSTAREAMQQQHGGRENKITKYGWIAGVMESLTVGLSLLIGVYLQERLGLQIERPSFLAGAEILLIAAGTAFAYAFVFVLRRSYRADPTRSCRDTVARLWINISSAYLLELALLFLVKDSNFALGRAAVLLGYLAGFALLAAHSIILMPALAAKAGREGKKKLVIKTRGAASAQPDIEAVSPSGSDRLSAIGGRRDTKIAGGADLAEQAETDAAAR